MLPPLDTLPRGAPPPRDTGSRTHSTPGARMGTQGRVGGVGAGRARMEATLQPPRPECTHRLETLQPQHYRPAGDDLAVHAPTRVGAGRSVGGRSALSLAGVCAARAAGHKTRAPLGAIYNCRRLFVVQTCIRYLVRNEMSDLGENLFPEAREGLAPSVVCPEPAASAAASDSGRRLCVLVWEALGPAAGSQCSRHCHGIWADPLG